MPNDEIIDPPLLPRSNRTPFEWSLSGLQPVAAEANSAAILFQAGRSSRNREVWMLKLVSAIAGTLAISLSVVVTLLFLPKDETPTVPQPLFHPSNREPELPQSESTTYVENTSSNLDQRIHLSQPVRPWRAMEPARPIQLPGADASELAELLQYRRSLLNTGLGLLPTDVPDFTSTSTPRSEK